MQPLAHIIAAISIDGEKFEVENFRVNFMQPTDFKGQPQHEITGGQISVNIPQAATDTLYNWAKKSTMQKSGEIVFQTDMGMTILTVAFTNAYCINLAREINASTGTFTSLTLSPQSIALNGVTHNNF